jgi:hypothetical protein
MRATTCGVSDPADSSDKAIVGAPAPCISRHSAARRRKAEGVRDNLGHTNIEVTQNLYGKSRWQEFCPLKRSVTDPLMQTQVLCRADRRGKYFNFGAITKLRRVYQRAL